MQQCLLFLRMPEWAGENMSAPTRPPTAAELLAHSDVIQALFGVWADSRIDDPTDRHEENGWVCLDLSTGVIVSPSGASPAVAEVLRIAHQRRCRQSADFQR